MPADAQILQGDWVNTAEQAINQHRKTEVGVIVLDQDDNALQGVEIQIEQQRHDFLLGLTVPADRMPPDGFDTLPGYRCFNALSMGRLTDWSVKPGSEAPPSTEVAIRWREAIKPIHTTFGRVVSVDPARNADELSLLEPNDLYDVLMARVDYAVGLFPKPDSFDLYCDLLHRNMIQREIGHGMAHRLFEYARAKRPEAQLKLRVQNAISLRRGWDMLQAVQKLEVRQLGFDAVTIEQRFNGQVNPYAFARMLNEYVDKLNVPVTFAELEVGGATAVASGINMETVLRLLFAQPKVQGLYFAGMHANDLVEPNAELIDDEGRLTPAGEIIDNLFRRHWWTSKTLKTDERGHANARVFTGWHSVTATLANGKQIRSEVYIPKADRPRLIVLQATAVEAVADN